MKQRRSSQSYTNSLLAYTRLVKSSVSLLGHLSKALPGFTAVALIISLLIAASLSAQTVSAVSTWQNDRAKCEAAGGTWTSGHCDVSSLVSGGVPSMPDELSGLVLDRQTFFFLSSCFVKVDMDTVTPDELNDWGWLKTGSGFGDFLNAIADIVTSIPLVGGVYQYTPGVAIARELADKTAVRGDMYDNPAVACEDGQWIKEAFERYGLTDPEQTFCSLPFTFNKSTGGNGKQGPDGRQNTQACLDGSGDYDGAQETAGNDHWQEAQANGLYDLLRASDPTKFAATSSELLPAANYVRQYRTFAKACDPTFKRVWTGSDTTSSKVFKVPVVVLGNDGTVITENVYVATDKANENTKVAYVATRTGDYQELTCRQLTDGMVSTSVAYARWLQDHPGTAMTELDTGYLGDTDPGGGTTGDSTCGVEGVGWLVCPIMTFLGGMNDAAFGFLANSFLETKVSYLTVGGDTYNAWSLMRNIANVAFVIAFMLIIYSQITGAGITNYGLKKLIPKLVISAILVNISFFVCQIAVDISNILGYSVKSLFDSFGGLVQVGAGVGDVTRSGFQTAGLIAAIIAGGAILLMALSIPLLLASLLALIVILFILLARTALIILLIVISPLAFVAYLLPNTEQWFEKWRKAFTTLLLLFPIIAVVFGASSFAAQIVLRAGTSGDTKEMMQLIALGIATIPLFAVPTLLKGALAAAGSIGAKLSSLSTKANSGIGKAAKDSSLAGAYGKQWQRNKQLKRNQILGGVYKGKNPFSKIASAGYGKINNSRLSGKIGTRTASQAAQLAGKLEIENVEAANAQIRTANITGAALQEVANGGSSGSLNGSDSSMRAAAIAELAKRGDFKGLNEAWDKLQQSGSESQKVATANALASSSDRPAYIGQGALQGMREGKAVGSTALMEGAIRDNVYSAERIATTDRFELAEISQVAATSTNITVQAKQRLVDHAHQAQTDPQLARKIDKNADAVDALRTNTAYEVPRLPPTPTAPPPGPATPPPTGP